jgi:hypothetical protein
LLVARPPPPALRAGAASSFGSRLPAKGVQQKPPWSFAWPLLRLAFCLVRRYCVRCPVLVPGWLVGISSNRAPRGARVGYSYCPPCIAGLFRDHCRSVFVARLRATLGLDQYPQWSSDQMPFRCTTSMQVPTVVVRSRPTCPHAHRPQATGPQGHTDRPKFRFPSHLRRRRAQNFVGLQRNFGPFWPFKKLARFGPQNANNPGLNLDILWAKMGHRLKTTLKATLHMPFGNWLDLQPVVSPCLLPWDSGQRPAPNGPAAPPPLPRSSSSWQEQQEQQQHHQHRQHQHQQWCSRASRCISSGAAG